jgi:glycosyltransferase involved in cell wall biosynthesis
MMAEPASIEGNPRLGLFISGTAKEGAICAFDLVRHARGMGHAMSLYAPRADECSDRDLWVPLGGNDLDNPGWWNRQSLELAIFYGVGSFSPEILRRARQSEATVIVECDSDGLVSPLQSPFWRLLQTHIDSRLPLRARLRSAKAWLDDWLWSGSAREKAVLESFSEADYIKIESEGPAAILRLFFLSRDRDDLARKIVVIPFAVRGSFSAPAVREIKKPIVLLAGRLGALQKGPVETLNVLRRLLNLPAPPLVEIHIRGEAPEFDELAGRHPSVSVHHDTPAKVFAERLREAQIVFSCSRWETTPVLALEALCSGCTIVAPQEIPGYASLAQKGRFGQTYPRNSPRGAVAALQRELSLWETGRRDSRAIAEYWRERCNLDAVINQLLALRNHRRAESLNAAA